MRWIVLLPFLVSACGERQSFDQRYEQTSERLQDKAEALDAELANGLADETVATDNTQRAGERR